MQPADRVQPAVEGEERERVPVHLRGRRLPPAPLGGVPDLVGALPDRVDLVAGDVGAEQLHRPRQGRAGPPALRARLEDPHLAQLPVAAPPADRPQAPAERHGAERVRRARQRRARAPAVASRVVDEHVGALALVPAADDPELARQRDDRVVRARRRQRRAPLPLVAARVVGVHLPPSARPASSRPPRRSGRRARHPRPRGRAPGAGAASPRRLACRIEPLHAVEVAPAVADHPAGHVDPAAELRRRHVAAPVRHRRAEAPVARDRPGRALVPAPAAAGGERRDDQEERPSPRQARA